MASLGPNCRGNQWFCSSHSAAEIVCFPFKQRKPLPINGSDICDKGARSPEAPRDPCSVTKGYHPWLYIAAKRSNTMGRMAENPLEIFSIFNHNIALTNIESMGNPRPAAWVMSKLFCNSLSLSADISIFCSEPNPVLTP